MKIYIVEAGWDYEGSDVKGVFTSPRKAAEHEERLVELVIKGERSYHNITVTEWESGEKYE